MNIWWSRILPWHRERPVPYTPREHTVDSGAVTVTAPMSEADYEALKTEWKRRHGARAGSAEERLRLARQALIRDGYFTADEIGDDIAPRIVEWLSHHRARTEEAEAELARLREGEEPGYDPLTVPTPGQWIARWNRASAAERLHAAERAIWNAAKAGECFEMNHVARLEEDRQALVKLARVRELRDTWLLMTLEPGQVLRLLDGITRALDGQGQGDAVCAAYRPPATAANSGLCARCGMFDYEHQAPADA